MADIATITPSVIWPNAASYFHPLPNQKLPPPTMHIDIRANCDYSDVPRLVRYQPEFTVASGVSAPKIVTAIATDGLRYKQLVGY